MPERLWTRRAAAALIAAAVVAGFVIRVAIARSPTGVLDSDEAVVGLMARHFGQGQFRAFFWGQNYGGTIETVLTAAVFKIVGTSTAALKAVPLALNAVAALLLWRLARRLMGAWAAVTAGLLMWLWPANYVWWSIKARGFYEAALCITLALGLLILRIADESERNKPFKVRRDWALLGLLAGLGWWQTPQVVYILAPAGLWLAFARPQALTRVWAAVPGAVAGALPWIWANIRSGLASFNAPPAQYKQTYGAHLLTFMRNGLPMTFGLKYIYLTYWIGSRHLVILAYAAGVGMVAAGVLKRRRESWLLGLIILAYPFIHAVLTLSSEVAEGRYTLFLLPWLILAIVRATERWWATAAVFAVALAITRVGVHDLRDQTAPYAPDERVPTAMGPLVQTLESRGITRVWANYWIAYRLTFEARERVIAASTLVPRYPQYNRDVNAAPDPAFVFIVGSGDIYTLHVYLQQHRIDYTESVVDRHWVIDVPAQRIDPDQFPPITA